MSALATATGSINLGQGFPDTDGPASLLRRGAGRRSPTASTSTRRARESRRCAQAIAAARLRDHGQRFDPDTEVLVTVGATEALAAAVLGLCEPGDEVLMLEPHYDSYPPIVAMAGGTPSLGAAAAGRRPAGSPSTSTNWRPRSARAPGC